MIAMMPAELVSVWDSGEFEVHSIVMLKLFTEPQGAAAGTCEPIANYPEYEDYQREPWYVESGEEHYGVLTGDEVDVLEEEYITDTATGELLRYTAMSRADYEDFGQKDPGFYDKYGHGIVLYD